MMQSHVPFPYMFSVLHCSIDINPNISFYKTMESLCSGPSSLSHQVIIHIELLLGYYLQQAMFYLIPETPLLPYLRQITNKKVLLILDVCEANIET